MNSDRDAMLAQTADFWQQLQQLGPPGATPLVGLAAVLLVLGAVGRAVLPAAACAALAIVGLSSLVFLLGPPSERPVVGVGLALFWMIAARLADGTTGLLCRHGAAVCGAIAIAALSGWATAWPDHGAVSLALTLGLTVAIVFSAAVPAAPVNAAVFLAAIGGLAWLAVQRDWVDGDVVNRLPGLSPWLGLVAVAAPVAVALRYWRYRHVAERTAPERLLDPPPRGSFATGLATGLGTFVLLVLIARPESAWLPLAVACATWGVGSAHHLSGSATAGALGLILAGASWYSAIRGWFPATVWTPLCAAAFSAGFPLWLARFWDQQLHDGVPWTTTGRLIPTARTMAHIGCVFVAMTAAHQFSVLPPAPQPLSWSMILGLLLTLACARFVARDARTRVDASGVLAAGVVFAALIVPVTAFLRTLLPENPLTPAIAASAALFAFSVTRPAETPAYRGGVLGYLLAVFIPLLIAHELTDDPAHRSPLAWALAGVLLLTAGVVRLAGTQPPRSVVAHG